jgi:hypothetical protein
MCHTALADRRGLKGQVPLRGVQQPGGFEPVPDAQSFPGLAQVIDHCVVREAELPTDLLAVEMPVDQAKNLTFAVRQPFKASFVVLRSLHIG